jgi:ABC-type branched-subunit amino acid transport system substrate-binding protein
MWDQHLKKMSAAVGKAISDNGLNTNEVGVYIIGFDEIIPILIQAQNHKYLDKVRWYGSDGTAKNERLLKTVEAAEFAEKTNFTNPLPGVEKNNDRVKTLEDKISEKIKRQPDAYYANAYDAFWVAALTENVTKETRNVTILKDNLYQIARTYSGLTGSTSLDSAGDRSYGSYDFWAIAKKYNNTGYEWKNMTSLD